MYRTDDQHRMGQTRPVQAIKLMIKDSVEEKLDKLQRKKANLAKVSLTGMTSKELMEQKVSPLYKRCRAKLTIVERGNGRAFQLD
jgi:SNF2 family DNA or RNA helicase